MKVQKFLKHIIFFTHVILIDREDEIVYEGSIVPFHAIFDKDEDYFKELTDDKDLKGIQEYKAALKYANWHLDTTDAYEAVSVGSYTNENNVVIPKVLINIKEKKND